VRSLDKQLNVHFYLPHSRLNRVEILAELSKTLGEKYMVAALALQFPSSDNTENHEPCATIAAIKSEKDSEILELLPLALQLADALDFVGDLDAAENAYRRILDIYRPMGRNNWYNVKRLLRKLAKLSWKRGNDQLAQNFAWEALSWREVPPQANQSDLELLKDLGSSLSRTSRQLSDIIRSTPVGSNSETFNASVPPLQRMMEGTYASDVDGNPFATAELPKDNLHPPLQHPVVGGFKAIMDLLEVFPSADLHARDSNGRSPLYLSGSLRKECFGLSLIMYVKTTEGSTQSLVNSRDHSGQTVLGISVLNGCSIAFIIALVQNGAEVNPDAIPLAWTPLQAAAWVGSLEVVELLLGHGAIVDNVFPGSESPQYLAQQRGHFDLARRLDRSSSGSLGSSSAQRGTRS